MSSDATETYPIPPSSWCRAQQSPAIRSRIGQAVMAESALKVWDCQQTIYHCNFMNKGRGGKDLIPSCNWRRAQQSPTIRSRICEVVVEGSAIEFSDL